MYFISIEIFLKSQVFFVGSSYRKILLEGSQNFCRTLGVGLVWAWCGSGAVVACGMAWGDVLLLLIS